MINSAEEFKRLRESEVQEEYYRATTDEASIEVWSDVLKKYPDLAFWVAQNKTIPLEVLYTLADNENVDVRCMVARKRKIDNIIFDKLKADINESVRHALMCNTKIPIEKKQQIKTSDSEWLRGYIQKLLSN